MGRFAEALAARDFVVTCELIPGRGASGKSIESIMQFLEGIRDFPAVHALSITDNAGGNPALSADVLGAEIASRGMDTIVHFSCKDMSRNFIESRAFALQRIGVSNLLVVTGDYPSAGFLGLSKPVFDLDSVSALHYLSRMNEGLTVSTPRGTSTLPKTGFFLGAAVSPFKWTEGPCVMQYTKLGKKIRAGARFVITQLGWDARKHLELIQYVRTVIGSDVPLLGSVYVLTAGAAEVMARGEVPGCHVTPEMLALLREEAKAEDKGKRARLERAARQLAVLKGLGYAGAHIEGLSLKPEDVRFIVERAGELEPGWQKIYPEFRFAPPNPYYYFEGGEKLRLPAAGEPLVPRQTRRKRIATPSFWIMRALHHMFFTRATAGFRLMARFARFSDTRRGLGRLVASVEHSVKKAFFGCKLCDDCAAFETSYLCPESRCAKGLRNGPCGGSRVNERCEVFPDRSCAWRDIYWRAKNRGEVKKLGYIIPPRDWKLYDTGSWANYFMDRDHSAHPIEEAR